jgi:hypothetical protein
MLLEVLRKLSMKTYSLPQALLLVKGKWFHLESKSMHNQLHLMHYTSSYRFVKTIPRKFLIFFLSRSEKDSMKAPDKYKVMTKGYKTGFCEKWKRRVRLNQLCDYFQRKNPKTQARCKNCVHFKSCSTSKIYQ